MQLKIPDSLNLYLPSPIQELESSLLKLKSVRVFVKRDDLIHPTLSGNKWRKLKYNLANAKSQDYKTLLTFGGAFSNHIHATAAAGKIFGFNTIGIIRGEAHESLNPTLTFAREQNMHLEYVSRQDYRKKTQSEFITYLHDKFGDFYLIPEGGSNELALPGCQEIIHEINAQLSLPVDYVCTACGSGGTLAGLALAKSSSKILGFAVLKNAGFLNDDVRKLLGNSGSACWQINLDYHFGGYAKRTQELMEFLHKFRQDFRIPIEPVYTAKMFFGLFDMIRDEQIPKNSTIVALHTGGLQGFHEQF